MVMVIPMNSSWMRTFKFSTLAPFLYFLKLVLCSSFKVPLYKYLIIYISRSIVIISYDICSLSQYEMCFYSTSTNFFISLDVKFF